MGKIADATFGGASGKKYGFEVFSTDTSFNDVGAVYIFSKRTTDQQGRGTHDFLYIGETGELGTRISDHEKWSCVLGNEVNAICVHCDDGDKSRLTKETDLRSAHNTPCNDQ